MASRSPDGTGKSRAPKRSSLQQTTVQVPKPASAFSAGVLSGVLQPRLVDSFERVAYDALLEDPKLDTVIRDAVLRRPGPGGGQ